mgnify:CR=1 FL=1
MKEIYYKREQEKIKELAREYSAKGYEVILEPKPEDMPDFLKSHSYHPDLIVKSPKENLVIEVKSSESISSAKSLVDFAELIKEQDGWDFVLVFTNPKQKSEEPLGEIHVGPEHLDRSIKKVEYLLSNNSFEFDDVALLYLWSIIEAVLRFGLTLSEVESKGKNIKSLLRDSIVFGIISKNDYESFFPLMEKRNSISHGFLENNVSRNELEKSLRLIKRIYNELSRQEVNNENKSYIDYLRTLSEKELDVEIDNIICEITHELIDSDEVNSLIAITNTYAWDCDDYNIEEIEILDTECIVTLYFHASGDQDDDKPFHGNSISGKAEAVIGEDESVYFQKVSAHLDIDDEDYEM